MTVKQRLIEFAKSQEKSVRSFEIKAGLNPGYVNNIRQSIQPDKLQRIAQKYPQLNPGWLMTGEGNMLQRSRNPKESEGLIYVPLLPIAAQGGSLNEFIVSVKDTDCEKVVSPIRGADFAITVAGDSMAPEYPSGAQILIKRINERAFIDWGKTYVLDTCNGTVIKKVFPAGDQSKIKCVSISPDYPPFEIDMEDVYGMYRVLLCMSIK